MHRRALWKNWWFWVAPLACASAGLIVLAEALRDAQSPGWADLADVVRLGAYCAWLRPAWQAAAHLSHRIGTVLARAALIAGLVANALA